ncbi:MAG: glycosyltransferase, partial [Brevefilum sp.]|nr:glycosyltransferase [Brevefilum sp.]
MNILMITFNPTGRGTYFRAYQFARELVNLQYSVTLLTTAPSRKTGLKTWQEHGIQLVEFPALLPGPFRSGWDPLNIYMRLRWLKGRRFDIVHAFESRPSVIYPALKARRNRARLVLDWCDWFGKGGSVE